MDQATKLYGEYRCTSANTDKQFALKADIKNLKNKIDQQVYKLCGLSREEIAIKEA